MRIRVLRNLELTNYIFERAKEENIKLLIDVTSFLEKNREDTNPIPDTERDFVKDEWYKKIIENNNL